MSDSNQAQKLLSKEELETIGETFCTIYTKRIYLKQIETPSCLLDAIAQILPDKDKNYLLKLIDFGGIFINGAPIIDPDYKLLAPVRLELYIPKFDIYRPEEFFPQFNDSWIAYKDDDIAIVFKPKGLPTIPSREQRVFNLRSYLQKHFGHNVHMPSRLDMSTSGILLVSLSSRANAPIQRLYESHQISKSYLFRTATYTHGDKEILCEAPICKHPEHPVLRSVRDDGQTARTDFVKIADSDLLIEGTNTTLVQAKPVTGRTHQIRVHAKYIGAPIFGDSFYGGTPSEYGLHLMAAALSFPHPITREQFSITVPKELLPYWVQ